ncbi:MAG: DUF2232 domain-containing protein [Pseudomonadota bacterium]
MSRYLVAFLAGLASVVVFLAPLAGTPIGILFGFLIVPLPIAIAGLGWGWPAALIASLVAAGGAATVAGPPPALVHFLTAGLPITGFCYLLNLNRDYTAPNGQPATEWYPVGRVLAAVALWSAVLTAAGLLIVASDFDGLRNLMRQAVDRIADAQVQMNPDLGARLTETVRADLANRMLPFVPAGIASFLVVSLVFNLWLGGRIAQQSGQLTRPWPDMTTAVLPRGFSIIMMVAILVSFVGGYIGLIANGLLWSCVMAYVLIGLAIIHQVTRGQPIRGLALVLLYLAIILLIPVAIVVAVIGLAEPFSPLRRRHLETDPPNNAGGPPPQTPNTPTNED